MDMVLHECPSIVCLFMHMHNIQRSMQPPHKTSILHAEVNSLGIVSFVPNFFSYVVCIVNYNYVYASMIKLLHILG